MASTADNVDVIILLFPSLAAKKDDPSLRLILASGEVKPYSAGEVLHHQEQPVESIHLVIEGQVSERQLLVDPRGQRRVMMRTVEPGRWLGLFDLIYRRLHTTTATVEQDARAIVFSPEQVFRLLYEYPELWKDFLPLAAFNRLRTVPFLATLSPTHIGYLAEACRSPSEVKTGEVIYKAGDPVNFIYIIDQGQVKIDGGELGAEDEASERWFGNSAAFGFIESKANLIYLTNPYDLDHTVTALCPTRLYRWSRADFVQIAGFSPEQVGLNLRVELQTVVQNLSIFAAYDKKIDKRLMGYVGHFQIPHHQLLIQQGEFAESTWVLMPHHHATLYASDKNRNLQKTAATGLTYFNELALRVRRPCASTLQAEPQSQWLRLHWQDFRKFLDQEKKLYKNGDLEDKLRVNKVEATIQAAKAPPSIPGLEADEVLILLQKRHWIILARALIIPALLALLALALWVMIPLAYEIAWLLNVVVGFFVLVAGGLGLWQWADYRNDFLMLTNKRIAQQEKIIFFKEERHVTSLDQVRDVQVQSHTIWGNFWQYGTLTVQTAVKGSDIVFDYLPNAEAVQVKIREEQSRRKLFYDAGGKREIYNALERQLGLNLDLPARVVQAEKAAAPTRLGGSLWKLLFASAGRQQLMTDYRQDRIVWRKHWVVLARMAAIPALFAILSTLATVSLIATFAVWQNVAWGAAAIPLGFVTIYLWAFLWWRVQDWHNDTYELTAGEIIDTEMRPISSFKLLLLPFYLFMPSLFFDKDISRAGLGDIIDVTMNMTGPINHILNYGDVLVQTAAQQGKFTFDEVPNPGHVMEEIRRRVEQYHAGLRAQENQKRIAEMPVWFEMYDRLGEERERAAQI